MDEKVIELPKILAKINYKIDSVYPFNIKIEINPKEPQNSFIITITKKAFKKFEKQIMQEIEDTFHEDYKVDAEIIFQKKEKPLFGNSVKLFFQIKVN